MRPGLDRSTHLQNFAISLIAHIICFILLIGLPMCRFRRIKKPEHKIYTFSLIDPSLISMKKTTIGPTTVGKGSAVIKKGDLKKETAKKEVVKKEKKQAKEDVKKEKKAPKKESSKKKSGQNKDKDKMGLRESERKMTIEEKIQAKLKKISDKKWVEAEDEKRLEETSEEAVGKSDMVATGDFTNISYNDAVASRIYDVWQTPSKSIAESAGLTVVIRFKVFRDGKVNILRVEKKSGNEVLDNSALQAIKDAEPLPPLPEDYKGDSLEVCMIFVPEE